MKTPAWPYTVRSLKKCGRTPTRYQSKYGESGYEPHPETQAYAKLLELMRDYRDIQSPDTLLEILTRVELLVNYLVAGMYIRYGICNIPCVGSEDLYQEAMMTIQITILSRDFPTGRHAMYIIRERVKQAIHAYCKPYEKELLNIDDVPDVQASVEENEDTESICLVSALEAFRELKSRKVLTKWDIKLLKFCLRDMHVGMGMIAYWLRIGTAQDLRAELRKIVRKIRRSGELYEAL